MSGKASEGSKSAEDLGLTGGAKRVFEQWTALGCTWLEALALVERAGLRPAREGRSFPARGRLVPIQESAESEPPEQRDLVERFKALGLSEAGARVAAAGREAPVDDSLAVWRAFGLSEAEARVAAAGRDRD